MIDLVGLEPRISDQEIATDYARESREPGFSHQVFVDKRYTWPVRGNGESVRYNGGDWDDHAHAVLMSHIGTAADGPTTIGVPKGNRIVESGGRYRKMGEGLAIQYYWDTEPAVRLADAVGETQLGTEQTDNLRAQIVRFLRPPFNANAPEYTGRDQVNVYARLVRRDVRVEGPQAYERHLPAMLIEYWSLMEGAYDPTKLKLAPGSNYKWVGRMPDGSVLNLPYAEDFTYEDGTPRPRPESRIKDLSTKAKKVKMLGRELSQDEEAALYKELHTGAGEGNDYADTMLENGKDMATIRTTRRIKPFKNMAIFELECEIAAAMRVQGDEQEAEKYELAAMLRARAINKYCWNEALGCYVTYDLDTGQVLDPHVQDQVFALESGIAPHRRAVRIEEWLRTQQLQDGGLGASLAEDSEQSWSSKKNVWPNLQTSGQKGSWLYGFTGLEMAIGRAFLNSNHTSNKNTGYGKERYHGLYVGKPGVGGEYDPPEHNFTWDTDAEVASRRQTYRHEAERRAWLRRRNIADGVGRLAIP